MFVTELPDSARSVTLRANQKNAPLVIREAFKKKHDETYGKFHILGGVSGGHFPYVITEDLKCIESHFEHFWTLLFFSLMTPPPSTSNLFAKLWKFSKYFWTFKGKKLKSLRMSQKSFLDNKKSRKIFHMFRRFYFWKLPLQFESNKWYWQNINKLCSRK